MADLAPTFEYRLGLGALKEFLDRTAVVYGIYKAAFIAWVSRNNKFQKKYVEVTMQTYKNSMGLIVFTLVCLLWGCSSYRVSQDYDVSIDFSSLKTYAWQTENQPKTGDIRVDSSLLDDRIRAAINDSLSKKGYQIISGEKPDFYVAYTYQIHGKIASNNVTVGVGIGRSSRGRYGGVGLNSGGNISEYDEGLLAIDLNDVSTESLLWRGTGTTRLNPYATPEESVKGINAWVEKILSQFPPQSK